MNILIGCEESQVVCQAFRKRGHTAFSCDLVSTRGKSEWHLQCDILHAIQRRRRFWDMIVLHPDCTKISTI